MDDAISIEGDIVKDFEEQHGISEIILLGGDGRVRRLILKDDEDSFFMRADYFG